MTQSRLLAFFGLSLATLAACGAPDGGVDRPPPEFAVCSTCHATAPDGPNRSGPNLHGVIGRQAGSLPGFNYSAALRDSGIVWTPETLDRFLAAPRETVPGTRMVLAVPDPARRKVIVDWLARPAQGAPPPQ